MKRFILALGLIILTASAAHARCWMQWNGYGWERMCAPDRGEHREWREWHEHERWHREHEPEWRRW